MKLSEFNNLSLQQKSDLLIEWGFYLGSRKDEHHNYVLFMLNDFFAEIVMLLPGNKIDGILGMHELDSEKMKLLPKNHPLTAAAKSISKQDCPDRAA